MIFYADTIGLDPPTEGYISSSLGVEFDENTTRFGDETRKFGTIADSSFVSDFTTNNPTVLYDYRNVLATDFTSLKTFQTSSGKTLLTSNNEIFKTADADTDIGLRYQFSETSAFDFIAFHVTRVGIAADIKIYETLKNVIFQTSAGENFVTSDGGLFLTADNPNNNLGLLLEGNISSTGWTIIDFGSLQFYDSDGKKFQPSDADGLRTAPVGSQEQITTDIILVQLSGSFDIDISEIFMGTKYQPSRNFDIGKKTGAIPLVNVQESYSGREYSNRVESDKEFFEYEYGEADNTIKTNFESLLQDSQDQRFLINDNDVYRYVFSNKQSFDTTEIASGIYDIKLKFSNDRF